MIRTNKRSHIKGNQYKANQKRFVVDQVVTTAVGAIGVAISPASMLRFSFAFLFLGLGAGVMFGSLGIVPYGTAAHAVVTDAHLQLLWNTLDDVDEIRRNLMHTLRESSARLSTVSTLMANQHDSFAAAHPLLIDRFELVQEDLGSLVAQTQANISSTNLALDQIAAFEALIEPLDRAASRLQSLIVEIDPSAVFDDTDDEMIDQAARNVAERANFGGRRRGRRG